MITFYTHSEPTIQALWGRLRKDDTDMASNFEDFLYKVTNEIKRSKQDIDSLEVAMKRQVVDAYRKSAADKTCKIIG